VTPELDQLIQQLKANPNGAYIEIEGHTDNAGPKEANYRLGLERAENVKRYLYETHQVPLHKINVISYGEEKPVVDNKTKDNRAQNRRVVIKVIA
jgi:outer membrane protein OmpA-like peptidoglycan-associated protein